MTNNNNPVIPAKRYFTLDEMCQLVQISPAQFAQWQHENNVVIGYGGDRYTRSDVVKLLKLKDTFEPYIRYVQPWRFGCKRQSCRQCRRSPSMV